MQGRTTAVITAVAGALFGLLVTLAALTSPIAGAPRASVLLSGLVAGWAFIGVGAALWVRFPDTRVGAISLAVGAAIFVPELRWIGGDLAWTAGWATTDIHLVLLAWLVLAFPTGRLRRSERTLVGSMAAYFALLAVAGLLFSDPWPGCAECPNNLLLLTEDADLNSIVWSTARWVNLGLVAWLVVAIGRKRRRASTAGRRALAPVVWALGPVGIALVIAFVEPALDVSDSVTEGVAVLERLALIAFPAFLAAGMVRANLALGRVADLAADLSDLLTPDELDAAVQQALGDPSARVAFGDLSRMVDPHGTPIERDGQVATPVRAGTRDIGFLVHDPAVPHDLVDAVRSTAALAIENERLRAELRIRLQEVEASRQRIAQATIEERRRIERNLHDGVQQRLLALGASVGRARSGAEGSQAEALAGIADELRLSIDELREFARGVHPAILTDRGLGPAIAALAERSPVPVTYNGLVDRCPTEIEAATFYVVSEAVTNAIRHADADAISVRLWHDDGHLRFEVADDGIGGADPSGSGIQGIIDRVEALGGVLSVSSRERSGTTVEGWLPCG